MTIDDDQIDLTALADGTLRGPEWDAWLAAHPREAAEVAVARRVRALLAQLRDAEVPLPTGFEERVLARIHDNTTLLEVLELSLAGVGRALLEILDLFFGGRTAPRAPMS